MIVGPSTHKRTSKREPILACDRVARWFGGVHALHAYLIENGRIVMSGTAEALKENPDIQEFYLGGSGQVDYRNVKHYRRRKRWLA